MPLRRTQSACLEPRLTEILFSLFLLWALAGCSKALAPFGARGSNAGNGGGGTPPDTALAAVTIIHKVYASTPTYFGGYITLGSSADSTVNIYNGSSTFATLASPRLESTDGQFRFKGGAYPGTGGTCASSLAPGSSCTITLSFAPSAFGGYFGDRLLIQVQNGGDNFTLTSDLRGTAQAGSLDASYNSGPLPGSSPDNGMPCALLQDSNGSSLLLDQGILTRFEVTGAPDSAFTSHAGSTLSNLTILGFTVDSASNALLVGIPKSTNPSLSRLSPTGDPNLSVSGPALAWFNDYYYGVGPTFMLRANAISPSGDIYAAGTSCPFESAQCVLAVLRLSSAGAQVTTFGGNGSGAALDPLAPNVTGTATAVLYETGGTLLVLGAAYNPSSTSTANTRLLRFGAITGQPDRSLNSVGYLTVPGLQNSFGSQAVALQPDGKILLATADSASLGIIRLLGNGQPDVTFNGTGTASVARPPSVAAGASPKAQAVAVQPDGKLLVGGSFTDSGGVTGVLARFTPDGKPDHTFGGNGVVTVGSMVMFAGLAIDPTHGILVAGNATHAILRLGESLPEAYLQLTHLTAPSCDSSGTCTAQFSVTNTGQATATAVTPLISSYGQPIVGASSCPSSMGTGLSCTLTVSYPASFTGTTGDILEVQYRDAINPIARLSRSSLSGAIAW